jgi:hypothetical protein
MVAFGVYLVLLVTLDVPIPLRFMCQFLYVQEAGTEGGKAQLRFEEILKSNIAVYVVSSN